MFLKIVKSSQGIPYIYVAEGYRDSNGRVRHKYLFSLGKLDNFINTPIFKKLASMVSGKDIKGEGIISNISEGELRRYGHLVLKKVWDLFKLDEYFSQIRVKGKRNFDLEKVVFYMVSRQAMESDSKLGMYESKWEYIGEGDVGLNHLYRALDVLSEGKEEIEQYLFEQNKNLFNMRVDVVFYDVTTIYFESQREEEIRRYGFSKDGKLNSVQVVMGMVVDKEGRPVGYELFSGNTFDGKTLETVLEKMQKRFNIDKVIVVADKGINSDVNLLNLRKLGYGYIVAMRLRGKEEELLKEVFREEGYKEVISGEEVFRYKSIPYVNRVRDEEGKTEEIEERIVISYSSRRAEEERRDRERLIEKAEEMLMNPSSITAANKKGGRKYITFYRDRDIKWELDAAYLSIPINPCM